jgi:hypothetical protein
VVIRLEQGVQGHVGEWGFNFAVSVDGGQPITLTRPSGLLSDDIKYCPPTPNSPIQVSISTVKKGILWDDKYTSGTATLDHPLDSQSFTVTRNNMFGSPSYHSQITVQQRPFSSAPPAQPSECQDTFAAPAQTSAPAGSGDMPGTSGTSASY